MAYTINRYNGTVLTTVADGTVDTSTDLTFIGKNYAGYGEKQNENFLYLLENFANTAQPPNPLKGQIWFDSANSKLKFYDGAKFRTTGGAEIGAAPPTGFAATGDFWWDTTNQQLHAWTGTAYQLIGPQAVQGQGITQMQSISVKDSENGATHAIVQASINGKVAFIVSSDTAFTLDPALNSITGFDKIQQGVTLAYTRNADAGVTNISSNYRFHGTATNSDKLGGQPATNYLLASNTSFNQIVNFADVGYTVGNPTVKLKVFNDSTNSFYPTILNQFNDTIIFKTTVSSVARTPLKLTGNDVLPGVTLTSNLGSSSFVWNSVYASNFVGTATNSNYLNLGGSYVSATTASTATTIVARDSNRDIFANVFNGTSTSANYADLAEKYLTDKEYDAGTVVCIGGTAEVTAAGSGTTAIGVVSTNPAYMMNSALEGGTYIALKGRVPVKIIGPVRKGDTLVPTGDGFGKTDDSTASSGNRQFGIALEDNAEHGVKLVECVIL
jgi:hypothetical protein